VANFSQSACAQDRIFAWAIGLSLLAHVLVALVVPGFTFDSIAPQEITIELESPKPQPIITPEPIKPKVIPPQPKVAPQPVPEPKPVISNTPQVVTAPPPPAVIAVPAKPIEPQTPSMVVPVPQDPPKPSITPVDIDNAKNQYGGLLSREFAKHKQYPKIAQMRGWQGEVDLLLELDPHGSLIAIKILKSSGHEALDNQAIEMAHKSAPFPVPPESLRTKNFEVTVPVSFRLE
jgi:periplasmic protein TonB